jgi:type II secretory pathway predicted ATPase ExeA
LSSEFNGYVLRDAREYRNDDGKSYPVIPDISDPILSVAYICEAWCSVFSSKAKTTTSARAAELDIVECEIRRHKMVRLSNVQRLIADL